MPNRRRAYAFGMLRACLLLIIAMFCAMYGDVAHAQFPVTQLTALFPCGGQAGASFETTLTGSDLDDLTELTFSHPGIKAELVPLVGLDGKPIVGASRRFQVTIAPDVPRGFYEARCKGYFGLSNPRVFVVDQLSEVRKNQPNQTRATAQEIAVESIVNGKIEAEKSDFYRTTLKAGQRLLCECTAFRADSRLDATLILYDAAGNELARSNDVLRRDPLLDFVAPQDGVYVIEIYDFLYQGGENHGYRLGLSTRPRVDFVFPPAGQPGTKSRFMLYGRNLPDGEKTDRKSIDGAPLERLAVEIELPSEGTSQATLARNLDVSEDAGPAFVYRPRFGAIEADPIPIYLTDFPVLVETEPNNDPRDAHKLAIPCEVAGQFQARGDQDFFKFDAQKGETLWIEVVSERMGLNSDPYLIVQRVVKNDKGESTVIELAGIDESRNMAQQQSQNQSFDTSSADAGYKFVAPETGTYRILLRDLYFQSRGNSQYVYRLIVRKPTPDFRLLATVEGAKSQQNGNLVLNAAPVLQQGGTQAIRIMATREADFKGDIRITAAGLPPGVTCAEAVIGGDANVGMLGFQAAEKTPAWSGTIRILGKALIDGREVVHPATVGIIVWGTTNSQQSPVRTRLTGELAMSVVEGETQPLSIEIGDGKPVATSLAGKLEIPVKVIRHGEFKEPLKLSGVSMPKDMKFVELDIPADRSEGKLILDVKNTASPGMYSFVLQSAGKLNDYRRNPQYAERIAKAKAETDRIATETAENVKLATTAKLAAEKAVVESTAKLRSAESIAATAKAELQAATAKHAAAESAALAAATALLETASEKNRAAETSLAQAANAVTLNEAAKSEAAAELAAATRATAAAAALKNELDDRAKEIADAAKSKALTFTVFSQPVTVSIAPSPVEFAIDREKIEIRAGQKLEIPLKLVRSFGYDGDVKISLVAPGLSGIKGQDATIAKDQVEGKIIIESGDAPPVGDHHAMLRAKLTSNGQPLQTDVPVRIVVPAP